MDIQHALLSKAILGEDLRELIEARITEDFFPDDKYRRVYRYLLDHWKNYGVSPDEAVVNRTFPTYNWSDDPQPLSYFIDQLRLRREDTLYSEALNEIATVIGDDEEPERVQKVRQLLQNVLVKARLEVSGSRDTDLSSSYLDVITRLGERRSNPGHLRGLPTGFDGLDYVTGGFQPEQFIVLTGVPKSGKSSVMLYMALNIWRHGRVPLFVGFEMSNTEQEDRLSSMLSGISLTKILNGTTSVKEFLAVSAALKDLKNGSSFFFSSDITSGTTVSGIQSKIQQYQPDVVFIDGVYLMDSELDQRTAPKGSPAALTDISRSIKRLAQSNRIPIVVTTQSLVSRSRGGLNLASIGYTSAFGQDADLVLGVERQEGTNMSKFHVIESRSGPRKEMFIEWDWNRGYVGEIDTQNFAAAKTAGWDDDDD